MPDVWQTRTQRTGRGRRRGGSPECATATSSPPCPTTSPRGCTAPPCIAGLLAFAMSYFPRRPRHRRPVRGRGVTAPGAGSRTRMSTTDIGAAHRRRTRRIQLGTVRQSRSGHRRTGPTRRRVQPGLPAHRIRPADVTFTLGAHPHHHPRPRTIPRRPARRLLPPSQQPPRRTTPPARLWTRHLQRGTQLRDRLGHNAARHPGLRAPTHRRTRRPS